MTADLHLLVPHDAPIELLGDIGPEVHIHLCPAEGELDEAAVLCEFMVPPWTGPEQLRKLFGQLKQLKVVQTVSAGVEGIVDTVPPGVMLCSGSGAHDVAVSEWVLAAILAAFKRIPEATLQMAGKRWNGLTDIQDLEGATVLIVGFGSIGAAVEARLLPFGVKVLRVAKHSRDGVSGTDQLARLLPDADVLVDLLPLTPETAGLLGENEIRRLKPGALVVNAGRGGTVDRIALTAALRDGRIRAVLDVTDPEPLPDGDDTWALPNLVVTQHSAGSTPLATPRMWRMVREQVQRYVAGEPLLNIVTEGY